MAATDAASCNSAIARSGLLPIRKQRPKRASSTARAKLACSLEFGQRLLQARAELLHVAIIDGLRLLRRIGRLAVRLIEDVGEKSVSGPHVRSESLKRYGADGFLEEPHCFCGAVLVCAQVVRECRKVVPQQNGMA